MQITSIEEIKKLAEQYSIKGNKWHFHILTPQCQLNTENKYALILENATNNKTHVCYSEKPYMDIGKELVQLLHGKDVMKSQTEMKEVPPSSGVKKLLARAKELNKQGKFWHHHMLFSHCLFNKNDGKWTIIFEDQERSEIIESITASEPKTDLQYIESLFYSQRK
ncbi:MAG: hypothetical protein AAB929_05980 [Patescibacteria group bacterium]